MSRVAKKPVELPSGVEVSINGQDVSVKGSKGTLSISVHALVEVSKVDNTLTFAPREVSRKEEKQANALAGTTRALLNNMVIGVSVGYERKLELVGVGYRAKLEGTTLSLSLGFSHPVNYDAPEGITIETPKQTEIIVRGIDKQVVGQVCADIRAWRPPEPYKGKGIRYAGEHIVRKEAKKK